MDYLENTPEDEDSSDDDDGEGRHLEEDEDEEELPVFLWKPPSHGLGGLGQWEAHTRVRSILSHSVYKVRVFHLRQSIICKPKDQVPVCPFLIALKVVVL